MERSLQGLPPITRSKGPHSSICQETHKTLNDRSRPAAAVEVQTWGGSTYMPAGHVPYVPHIHDAALVPHHADGDGVLAHLWRHVLVHLDAQVFEHQQAWKQGFFRAPLNPESHKFVLVNTCGNAVKQGEDPDGFPLLCCDWRIQLRRLLLDKEKKRSHVWFYMTNWFYCYRLLTNSCSWLLAKKCCSLQGQSSRRRSSP